MKMVLGDVKKSTPARIPFLRAKTPGFDLGDSEVSSRGSRHISAMWGWLCWGGSEPPGSEDWCVDRFQPMQCKEGRRTCRSM